MPVQRPAGTDQAAWLTLLRTGLRQRLADCDAARRLADWLEQRRQLGREVFAWGEPELASDALPAADLTALLRACLTLLELPAWERVWRPNPPLLWRVPDALVQMRRLLAAMPNGVALEVFLPAEEEQGSGAGLQRRAALANALVAGLELSRDGSVMLDQDAAFGEIVVSPYVGGGVPAAQDAAA